MLEGVVHRRCGECQIDRYTEIVLPIELNLGERLVCDGSATIQVNDRLGKVKLRYLLAAPPPVVSAGPHAITMDRSFGATSRPGWSCSSRA